MTSLITANYTANCAMIAPPDSEVRNMLTVNCALIRVARQGESFFLTSSNSPSS